MKTKIRGRGLFSERHVNTHTCVAWPVAVCIICTYNWALGVSSIALVARGVSGYLLCQPIYNGLDSAFTPATLILYTHVNITHTHKQPIIYQFNNNTLFFFSLFF